MFLERFFFEHPFLSIIGILIIVEAIVRIVGYMTGSVTTRVYIEEDDDDDDLGV